ncbi:MAG: FkbM family methyltransferase [Roseburia sp.]|nr:FkbM family methyltransferase [Roseburia sp.]
MQEEFMHELRGEIGEKKIVIWGIGKNVCDAEAFLQELGIYEFSYADKDLEKQDKGFHDRPVLSPEAVFNNYYLLMTMPRTREITEKLKEEGLEELRDFFFLRKLDYYLYGSGSIKELQGGIEVFGNHGCSFGIHRDSLKNQEKIIVYSFGIGEDLSFSEQLSDKYKQCEIHAFDPTPKAIKFVENFDKGRLGSFHFYPYGLSDRNGVKRFFMPKNPKYVSGSEICNTAVDKNNTIDVEMRTLEQIMVSLGHLYIDILKMDIEGSEFEVIPQIMERHINVRQICVEFHDRLIDNGRKKRVQVLELLKKNYYELVYVSDSGEELTFIKKG